MQYVKKFDLGQRIPESNRIQLHMYLDFAMDRPPQAQANHGPQRMTKKHKALCKERAALHRHQYPPLSWADLKTCMLQATKDVIGDKKKQCRAIRGLPCKKWFDDQCKNARKHLKELTGDAYQHAAKKYHALLHKKKWEYVL